jgi:hypothetical protein
MKITIALLGTTLTLLFACTESSPVATAPPAPLFPALKDPQEASMEALLRGRLELSGRCLLVGNSLVIWPYGYTLRTRDSTSGIYNEKGVPVVQVGDTVQLSGGEGRLTAAIERQLTGYVPGACNGPLWIAGSVMK